MSKKIHSSLVTKAKTFLKTGTSEQQIKIMETLASQIDVEDTSVFNEELLAMMSDSHYEMAKKRKFGHHEMNIYCPSQVGEVLPHTIIDIVYDDFSFLVDSVIAEVNKQDLLVSFILHPVLYGRFNKAGDLEDVSTQEKKGYTRQAHIHVHIQEKLSPDSVETLKTGLMKVLSDVAIANRDWQPMLHKLKDTIESLSQNVPKGGSSKDLERYRSFLEYLYDNNYTLLGYREYQFIERNGELKNKIVPGQSLGLLQDDMVPVYANKNEDDLPLNLQELRHNPSPISISKTNRLATVHRCVPMDVVAIKTYDTIGNITGERIFIGLFTSVTYSRSVSDVPYLREKVDDVMALSKLYKGSHDRKALRHILEKYPRDELFQIGVKDLLTTAKSILRLSQRQRIALFIRRDPFRRYVSCLVYIPRDRFGTKLRKEIGLILENELNGSISNFYVNMDDSIFARVMFTVNVSQDHDLKFSTKKIEALLNEAGQTWSELLYVALYDHLEDTSQIDVLKFKYKDAFPLGYTAAYRAKQGVFDIEKIEHVLDSHQIQLDLYQTEDLKDGQFRLKVYNPNTPMILSEILPILENFGMRPISELPFEVKPAGVDTTIWVHDFLLEIPIAKQKIVLKDIKSNFEKAFIKIWYNTVENDGLNSLVITAGANWHETTIMRAYVRYLKQMGFPLSRTYVESAQYKNPQITRLIIDLFKAYHDPDRQKDASAQIKNITKKINNKLSDVESLDQDRVLRALVNLIEATLRTNYFQRQENGQAKAYLAFKFDSSIIRGMPEPVPYRETFVYSPRVEAIHLRGDKIARGGIRWSDRREDFRTEVLGLMKAQMVKNSVIVPVGAKGGFVVKTRGLARPEFMTEGIECYKILVRALLDMCDNRKGDKVIPPENVVRRDGDDPYLVVAADKGTATFSDTANALSQEYGFWLDDAFASGGSAGYDHKKMGITARGAWESVKTHFRAMDHNTQETPFTVIGVGDMGGDVFGNGMLLSEHIQLIGAFNHLHIFCDPNPDTKKSFKERQRLFKDVKGWDDYNLKILSKGGRIYSRSEKKIELTKEIQTCFDITDKYVTPDELLRHMLKARVDLLWFGGIGTYIKSTSEDHGDAGDKANDEIRVDGPEVRAKVIGEGANLGITQLGRIELAENGIKINTDFIDNSGGVDSSDHEVNIKILMASVMADSKHKMNIKSRNILLEKMTEEIADHVLRNNYQQAQAISLVEYQAKENLKIHNEFIQDLERDHGVSRQVEALPDQETIEQRQRLGQGLARPELCVLLSYAKITFINDLLASDIPDSAEMQTWLFDYFPAPLRTKYAKEITQHRLAREIIATTMANSLVNRMGPTFIKSTIQKTGASAENIARAYLIVRDAFGLPEVWNKLESLDNQVTADTQLQAMHETALLTDHVVTWLLTRLGRSLDFGKDIKNFGDGVAILQKNLQGLLTPDLKTFINKNINTSFDNGLPQDIAHTIALMPVMSSACDIIRIALDYKQDLLKVAQTYFEVGEKFQMDWLRTQARGLHADNHWEAKAVNGIMAHLYDCQAGMTVRILQDNRKKSDEDVSIAQQWFKNNAANLEQIDPLFMELRSSGTVDLPMLITAEQRLRQLYNG